MQTAAFSNTVLIVTGAASGIGRQLALQAARLGSHVIASDVNIDELEQTKKLGLQQGVQLEIHYLDVADKEAIKQFAIRITPTLNNRKLILINNAGVGLFSGSFNDTEQEDFEWLLDINLRGVIRMTKAFYPYFMQQNKGHIVNLSSVFGLAGIADQAAYCTAKFGVRGFTETLRMELMGTKVYTTVVHPGGIKTNIVRSALPKGATKTEDMHKKAVVNFDKVALTTPEKAAKLILQAVSKKKPRLVIGSDGRLIDSLTRMFPVTYTKIFKWQMNKMDKES